MRKARKSTTHYDPHSGKIMGKPTNNKMTTVKIRRTFTFDFSAVPNNSASLYTNFFNLCCPTSRDKFRPDAS